MVSCGNCSNISIDCNCEDNHININTNNVILYGIHQNNNTNNTGGICPLCCQHRLVFYCVQCLRNGDFVHSQHHCQDRFADKRLKLLKLKTNCQYVEDRCRMILQKRSERENIDLEIRKSKEKIELLKMAIKQKRENVTENKAKLKSLKEVIHQKTVKMPTYKDNLERLCKHVHLKKSILQRQNDYIEIELEALKVTRQQRLRQLAHYIFPVTEVRKSSDGNCDDTSTETALAEASRPMRVYFDKNNSLLPIKLLQTVLPPDGDYSSYCNWVAANKGVPIPSSNSTQTEPIKQNPAYRISATLAYSAQLVRMLAFYLDVRLPFNIQYSDFCSCELEEKRFKRYVYRLQICAASVLEAAGAFRGYTKNNLREPPLHMLLRASPLSLNNCVQNEEFYSHTFDDEEGIDRHKRIWWGSEDVEGVFIGASDDDNSELAENLQWDWETIGAETGQTNQRVQSPSTGFTPTGAGLVTSAAASIASLWRGWTAK